MPYRDTSDYAFYHTLLKGSYRKGVKAFKAIMQDPVLSKQFASSLGGISVIFGITDDGNSEELRSIFEQSSFYEDAILTYLSRCCGHTFETIEGIFSDLEEFRAMCEDGTVLTLLESKAFEERILADRSFLVTCLSNREVVEYITSDLDRLLRYVASANGEVLFSVPMVQEIFSESMSELKLCEIIQSYVPYTSYRSFSLIELITRENSKIFSNREATNLLFLHKNTMKYIKNATNQSAYSYLLNADSYCHDYLLNNPDKLVYLLSDGGRKVSANRFGGIFNSAQKIFELMNHSEALRAIISDQGCIANFQGMAETYVCQGISQYLGIGSLTTCISFANDENWSALLDNSDCFKFFIRTKAGAESIKNYPDQVVKLIKEHPDLWNDAWDIPVFFETIRTLPDATIAKIINDVLDYEDATYATMVSIYANSDAFDKALENEITRKILLSCQYCLSPLQTNASYLKKAIGSTVEEFEERLKIKEFREMIWSSVTDAVVLSLIKDLSGSTGSYTTCAEFAKHSDFTSNVLSAEDKLAVHLVVHNIHLNQALCSNSSEGALDYLEPLLAVVNMDDLRETFIRHDEISLSTNPPFYGMNESLGTKLILRLAGSSNSTYTSFSQVVNDVAEWKRVRESDKALRCLAEINNCVNNGIWLNDSGLKTLAGDYETLRTLMKGKPFIQNFVYSYANSTYFSKISTFINSNQEIAKLIVEKDIWEQIVIKSNSYNNNSQYYYGGTLNTQSSYIRSAFANSEEAIKISLIQDENWKQSLMGSYQSTLYDLARYPALANFMFSYEDYICYEVISFMRTDQYYCQQMNQVSYEMAQKYINDYNWVSEWLKYKSYFQSIGSTNFKQAIFNNPTFFAMILKDTNQYREMGLYITQNILNCQNYNFNADMTNKLEELFKANPDLFIESEDMLIGTTINTVQRDLGCFWKLVSTESTRNFRIQAEDFDGSSSKENLFEAPTIKLDTPPIFGFKYIFMDYVEKPSADEKDLSMILKVKKYSIVS